MTIDLSRIENVTLYTGSNGAHYCTCNCPCCSQKGRNQKYQGTIEQALTMFQKLPSMKNLYVFGNPDVTVDTDFCHEVMKEAIKRNIVVSLSTSGVGGRDTLERLLEGIPKKMVAYVSFSFDGVTQQEMSLMKGIHYPMEKALDGLEWCMKNGYLVKVQPTLWSSNYQKAGEIIQFFKEKGIKWFTFHIGSLEANVCKPTHQHLTPKQIREVHKQIEESIKGESDVKVRCPILYQECGEDEPQKWYCMHPERTKELLIFFTEKGIQVTHTPMASIFREDLNFSLEEIETKNIPALSENKFCPFSHALSRRDDTLCRYISRYWNYETSKSTKV